MQDEVFSGHDDAFAPTTLIRLGEELDIPTGEIRNVLATDRYTDAVRLDHDRAVQLGARGSPSPSSLSDSAFPVQSAPPSTGRPPAWDPEHLAVEAEPGLPPDW